MEERDARHRRCAGGPVERRAAPRLERRRGRVRRAVEERVDNVVFEQADAQVYPFDGGAFDVVISRTGAMFFGEPVVAFANIAPVAW